MKKLIVAALLIAASSSVFAAENIAFMATQNGSPYFGTGAVFKVSGVGEFKKQSAVKLSPGDYSVYLSLNGKYCGSRQFTAGKAQQTIVINCQGA